MTKLVLSAKFPDKNNFQNLVLRIKSSIFQSISTTSNNKLNFDQIKFYPQISAEWSR
jgi:hypothetical protein